MFPLAIVFAHPAAAQVVVPPTLTGEHLSGVPQVTASCNPAATSTICYTVSGTDTGPYPGTFTESGTATIGPQPLLGIAIPVLTFTASLTIDSGTGQVSGTKTLFTGPQNLATNLGFCTPDLRSFGVAASYQARIATPMGVFSDRGLAGSALNEGTQSPVAQFIEFFESSLSTPIFQGVTFAGLCDLTKQFVSKPGVANSLCVKLDAARDAAAGGNPQAESGALDAYIHEVSAQSGKAISRQHASLLISLARTLFP